jgi:hypothetical protein
MTDIWNATVSVTPDVLHQELGGETVLLNLANESYFGLDEVGTRVWQVLAETHSAQAVVAKLLEEYEVSAEQLRTDVEQLVEQLTAAGLVAVVPTASAGAS